MGSNNGADMQIKEHGVFLFLRDKLMHALKVFRTIGIARHNGARRAVLRNFIEIELGELANALFAAAGHTLQGELAFQIDGEHRLHIEFRTRRSNSIGTAAATTQRLKVVDHKHHVEEIARLFSPFDEFFSRKARIALAQGFIYQSPFRNRSKLGIDDVQLHVGVLFLKLIAHEQRHIVAARKRRRETQIHRRNARLRSSLEHLGVSGNGNLRRRREIALAHAVVEFLGRHAHAEIVEMLLGVEEEREFNEIHALALHHLQRQIATRVDNKIAFRSHSWPF